MTVGSLISTLSIGLIIGTVGRLVVPGRRNVRVLVSVAVCAVAALVGTALARVVGAGAPGLE